MVALQNHIDEVPLDGVMAVEAEGEGPGHGPLDEDGDQEAGQGAALIADQQAAPAAEVGVKLQPLGVVPDLLTKMEQMPLTDFHVECLTIFLLSLM